MEIREKKLNYIARLFWESSITYLITTVLQFFALCLSPYREDEDKAIKRFIVAGFLMMTLAFELSVSDCTEFFFVFWMELFVDEKECKYLILLEILLKITSQRTIQSSIMEFNKFILLRDFFMNHMLSIETVFCGLRSRVYHKWLCVWKTYG